MDNPRQRFCLRVWGPLAAFNRPELKVERISYDVITPSAARAIFSAIFWKPAIRWHITSIEVLHPIRTMAFRKNEVAALASKSKDSILIEDARQQKSGLYLRDVAYRLHAEMEYLPPEKRKEDTPPQNGGPETPEKYFAMFARRASKGQFFSQPYLGTRECAAYFSYVKQDDIESDREAFPAIKEDQDFGIMLFDMDFESNPDSPDALFFRASMKQGVISIPSRDSQEVLR